MNNIVRFVIRGVHNARLLRSVAIFALLLCGTSRVTAQIQVEYFWDADNGLGKCTRVNGSAAVGGELGFKISTDELSYGIHTLGVRAFVLSDTASYFSPTVYSYVVKAGEQEISALEYFWDNDPGIGNATRVAGATAKSGESVSFKISAKGLTSGIHTLGVRAKSVGWSPTVYSYVAKACEQDISAIEYFWDNDPGIGNATRVAGGTAKSGESVSFKISAKGLSSGVHTLGMRAKGVGWSPTVYKLVISETASDDCAQYIEYFWDADPGFGKGMRELLQPNAEGNDVSFEIPTTGLDDGVHTLCVRTKGRAWSPLTCYLVRVEGGEASLIDDIEYFWDTDPGYGKGIKVPFEQGSSVNISEWEPDIEGMTGDRIFCLRAHAGGGWSVIYSGEISFSVEGHYTLNEQLAEDAKRNFRSLSEMFAYFVARRVTADVSVEVRDGATFAYDATSTEAMGLLAGVAEDLIECGGRLKFTAASAATVSLTVPEEQLPLALRAVTYVDCENVKLLVNGEQYDFSLLAFTKDEVCPGGSSEAREWSTMSSALTVEYKAVPRNGCRVTNYIAVGVGDLPPMPLGNSGTTTDYIDYNVTLKREGVEVLSFVYRITVGPTVASKSVSFIHPTPADGAMADPGKVTIYWSAVGGAQSYLVAVEAVNEADGTVVCDTVAQTATNFNIEVQTGFTYRYSVKACGKCDSTAYFTRSLPSFRTNDEDVAALRVLYNALDGDSWKKRWVLDAETHMSKNYPGVTFNSEGRVTAIDLANCNLTGVLPSEGFVLPALASLNLSRNNITGDLSLFLDECASLTALNMNYNRLSVLDKALPSSITNLQMGGQYYYHTDYVDELALNDILMDKNNMSGIVAGDFAWYNHAAGNFSARPYFVIYDRNDTDFGTQIGRINYSEGYYKLTYLNGDYTLAQNSETFMMSYSNVADYSIYPARLSFVEGDANIDAILDILDVQHTLNYVASFDGASGFFNRSAANLFDDALLNVQDIVAMVNLLLEENNTASMSRRRVTARSLDNNAADVYISVAEGVIKIASTREVAALDILLEGVKAEQVKQLLGKKNHNVLMRDTDSGVRVVLFSLTGAVIPAGVTEIFTVEGDAAIAAVKAADSAAKAMSVAVENSETTRIESIEDANSGKKVIFDLTGRRIYEIVSTGVYIIDGEKVLVK